MVYKILILFFLSFYANAEVRKAFIYDLGKTNESPLFIQETTIETKAENERTWKTIIKDIKGSLSMEEECLIQNDKIINQSIQHFQSNKKYTLTTSNDSVLFTEKDLKNTSDKTKENKITRADFFVTGPNLETYIQKNWEALLKKEVLKVDFGVFEISDFVGFKFKMIEEKNDKIIVSMYPSQFFIQILTNSMELHFDKKSKKLVYFKGRTPLFENGKGNSKHLDAEIVYQ